MTVVRPLQGTVRDYDWGSPTAIPRLMGEEPPGGPVAEVWFGDHPGGPSGVIDGGAVRSLADVRTAEGRPPLPFLLKLLAAARPLSIQAHPSRERAMAGFAEEDEAGIPRDARRRNYRDPNHKPELIVALEPFQALCGFRTDDELAALVDRLDLPALAAAVDLGAVPAVTWLLSRSESEAGRLVAHVAERAAEVDDVAPELTEWLPRLATAHPTDPGVVVVVLLRHHRLVPGEALFLRAGVLHAYLEGLGVEVMASCDNVLRGGLTSKHVDVDELGRVLEPTSGIVPFTPVPEADGVARYPVPVEDFALLRVEPAGSERGVLVSGPAVALATGDQVVVTVDDDEPIVLASGRAALLDDGPRRVRVGGSGTLWLAHPG